MDKTIAVLLLCGFRIARQYIFAVDRHAHDVCVRIFYEHCRPALRVEDRRLDIYAAAYHPEAYLYTPFRDHFARLFVIRVRHSGEALESELRLRRYKPERGGVLVAEIRAVRYAAGESVFVHAAVQHDLGAVPSADPLRRGRHRQSDSPRLRNAESRLHVVFDKLCKRVHCRFLLF